MKHNIHFIIVSFLTLNITSCGSSHDQTLVSSPTPTPQALVSPSPDGKGTCGDDSLVGNWIGTNTLSFNADCNATFGSNKLTWKIVGRDIEFKSGAFSIDLCAYEISPQGGLSSNLVIYLNLLCDKAGILKYTFSP